MSNMSKLSPQARRALEGLAQDADRYLDVFIATRGVLEPDHRLELEQLGCRINIVAGDVITVSIPVRLLASLSELDFVRYVEISRPLYPESSDADNRIK